MPHFFLVLSVNGSGPNSLSGGNDSGKFGNSGVRALALFGGAVAGLGSSGAMPSGYRRFNRRLMKAWTACLVVVIPLAAKSSTMACHVRRLGLASRLRSK